MSEFTSLNSGKPHRVEPLELLFSFRKQNSALTFATTNQFRMCRCITTTRKGLITKSTTLSAANLTSLYASALRHGNNLPSFVSPPSLSPQWIEGNQGSHLSPEEMKELVEMTPFNEKEILTLLKRYVAYDPSPKGEEGMAYEDCITMPEFVGNKLTPLLIKSYTDSETGRIYPKQFLLMCATLSDKVSPEKKKEELFNLYDNDGTELLTHDEIFRMYQSLFHGATTDNHILELTYIALQHPDLAKEGEITKEEFFRMLPDNEAYNRMTVDFQF